MSSSGSLSMSISGDESSSFEAISSIETSCSETYLSQVDGVKQLKRSRFGEVHVWKQLKNIGSRSISASLYLFSRQ